jgi:hypothetical protein
LILHPLKKNVADVVSKMHNHIHTMSDEREKEREREMFKNEKDEMTDIWMLMK